VSVPREPPTTGRVRAAIAGFPGRTQHLIYEALAAPRIADAPQSNIEIFIAAIHGAILLAAFSGKCRNEI